MTALKFSTKTARKLKTNIFVPSPLLILYSSPLLLLEAFSSHFWKEEVYKLIDAGSKFRNTKSGVISTASLLVCFFLWVYNSWLAPSINFWYLGKFLVAETMLYIYQFPLRFPLPGHPGRIHFLRKLQLNCYPVCGFWPMKLRLGRTPWPRLGFFSGVYYFLASERISSCFHVTQVQV